MNLSEGFILASSFPLDITSYLIKLRTEHIDFKFLLVTSHFDSIMLILPSLFSLFLHSRTFCVFLCVYNAQVALHRL